MKILNIEVDNVSFNEAIAKIEQFIKSKKSHRIVTVNPEYIVRAQNDKKLRTIINQADLRVPDGIGLVTLAGLKERVTGIDLIWQLAKLSEDRGYKIALLGGRGVVARQAASRIKLIHPRAIIAMVDPLGQVEPGTLRVHGLATLRVNLSLVREIERTKPDIALVALGMGKQDVFIEQLLKKVKIPVAIGVGGAFDMISGVTPRAPNILRTLGLEWLWRLIIEPKRLGRILTATVVFPILYFFKQNR
ncbi:WecB/TagA/CpsF family glycosyltransferase [Candidatus Berkelbacteria bacterium]|nr:WecB/TagA/CpsF family glycosyltransferase [Candidatus Berkelbacteria bacterium]